MINAKLDYNTKSIKHNGKVYCAYFGSEIKHDTEIDGYDSWDYYHCDCEDALKEIEIANQIKEVEKEINRLKGSMPKVKYGLVTETNIKLICK